MYIIHQAMVYIYYRYSDIESRTCAENLLKTFLLNTKIRFSCQQKELGSIIIVSDTCSYIFLRITNTFFNTLYITKRTQCEGNFLIRSCLRLELICFHTSRTKYKKAGFYFCSRAIETSVKTGLHHHYK